MHIAQKRANLFLVRPSLDKLHKCVTQILCKKSIDKNNDNCGIIQSQKGTESPTEKEKEK